MIYEIFIALAVLACFLYYIFCILEIAHIVKFTDKNTVIEFPKWLIPFYYFFKSSNKEDERKLRSRIKEQNKEIENLEKIIEEQRELSEEMKKYLGEKGSEHASVENK